MATHNLIIGADVQRAVSELQKLNSFTNSWASQMRGAITSAFSFYAVYNGLKSITSTLNTFNVEMSKLKALTGETGVELERLRQNALGLAGAYDAITVAQAQVQLSKAGFSTQEINDSVEAVTLLATAAGVDLPKATDIAASTLRGFGLAAKEMQRVTDVMAKTLNETQADLSDFGEAMKYVAPNAKAANVSLEETAAMIGVLSNAGIKGSMAGTALRRLFQDLAKDGRPVIERLRELGINGLTASDAFEEVGRIGSTALLILANNTPAIDKLNTSLHNVAGSTKAMADIMMDNVIGDWNKLTAAFDQYIQKADGVLRSTRSIIQYFTDLFRVNALTDEQKKLIGVTWTDSMEEIVVKIDAYAKYIKGKGGEIGATFLNAVKSGNDGKTKPWWEDYGKADTTQENQPVPQVKNMIGLIPTIQARIKELGEQMEKTWDGSKIRKYATEIEKLKNVIKEISEPIEQVREKLNLTLNTGKIPSIDEMFLETAPSGPGKNAGESTRFTEADRKALDRGQRIGRAFVQGFRSIVHGITDVLVAAFSGGNWWAALMDTIGNVAIQLGTLIIGIGVGLEAVKEALENPFGKNPALAIAAGVALVGLGAALKAGAAAIASGGSGGGAGQQPMPRWADRDVSIKGDWRIRGTDLVYVLDKQGYRTGVVGG